MINAFFESLDEFFKSLNEVSRRFQYDYIYIDAFFLAIWLSILIKKKNGTRYYMHFSQRL